MEFENVLSYLKLIKTLGIREHELTIPIPQREEREPGGEESYGMLLNTPNSSFHADLLSSEFPYTRKGSFAFSLLANELASKPKEGRGIKAFKFAKVRKASGLVDDLDRAKERVFAELPEKAVHEREIKKAFAVYGDGKHVHCYIRFRESWKRMFALPYTENTWHVDGPEFVAAYSLGKNLYGTGEFNPSLENLIFAESRDLQYGWVQKEYDSRAIKTATAELSDGWIGEYGDAGGTAMSEFLVLASAMRGSALAEHGGKRMYAPEFIANIPYLLVRSNEEAGRGGREECTFLLRTASDLCMLALRCAPYGGSMLRLSKHFDSGENLAGRSFAAGPNLSRMLDSMGLDMKNGKSAFIHLKEGVDFSLIGGKPYLNFGTLLAILRTASFFRDEIRKKGSKDGGWKSAQAAHSRLFTITYGKESVLDLLDWESEIPRGSDVVKVEEFFSKLAVKRAMVLEGGKAKEIKAHLSRLIEIADKRSVEESAFMEEMGSWGESVYELAAKERRAVLALISARRFY